MCFSKGFPFNSFSKGFPFNSFSKGFLTTDWKRNPPDSSSFVFLQQEEESLLKHNILWVEFFWGGPLPLASTKRGGEGHLL